MPSVIGTDSGSGINVAANYLKTKPSTRFATRQLAFFDVQVNGCATNPYDANSLYSRAVRGVQVAAEIYAVGEPASDHFIVVVATDTAADPHYNDEDGDSSHSYGSGYNAMAQSLQSAIGAICQDVAPKHLHGAGFGGGRTFYSDESMNDC
jgi:hypothetical protein